MCVVLRNLTAPDIRPSKTGRRQYDAMPLDTMLLVNDRERAHTKSHKLHGQLAGRIGGTTPTLLWCAMYFLRDWNTVASGQDGNAT